MEKDTSLKYNGWIFVFETKKKTNPRTSAKLDLPTFLRGYTPQRAVTELEMPIHV